MFTFPIKCAIIFRALITLISQQINSLFPTTDTTDTFAFIGNLKNFTQAEQLAQKWQFNIRYVGEHLEKIPTNHEALKNATHILTDISCINYGEALTYIANSNHKKSIAFFYPDTQTIITGKDIYI
jgi:hypothetical protein